MTHAGEAWACSWGSRSGGDSSSEATADSVLGERRHDAGAADHQDFALEAQGSQLVFTSRSPERVFADTSALCWASLPS